MLRAEIARVLNGDTEEEKINSILSMDSFLKKEKDSIVMKSAKKSVEVRKRGNEMYGRDHNFGQENHKAILSLYSESIALAPKDSEELAIAYGNRSALLKHLNFPEKSLIDIDRALEISKSDDYKMKLLTRKTECLKLKDEADKLKTDSSAKTQKLKFPSFTPSEKIPCAAESITIDYNETYGRCIVATRDIKPGEVVIVEEGYALFPISSKMYLICSHCLTFAWNGIPCDYCALAIYCSENCKNKARQEYHDVECSILPFLLSQFSKADLRCMAMTTRIFIKAVKSDGLKSVELNSHITDNNKDLHMEDLLCDGIYGNTKFKFCCNLWTNEKKSATPMQEFYVRMIIYLLLKHSNLLDDYKTMKDNNLSVKNPIKLLNLKKILNKITNVIAVNFHTFQGSLCECSTEGTCSKLCTGKRGTILALCTSLINHSCHPNVSRMFMPNGKVVIFTTCPVKKGEQLCDTYGMTIRYNDTWMRQMHMRCNYGFNCGCLACEENWTRNLKKTELTYFKKLNPKWYRNRYLKPDVQYWPYNEQTMKDVIEASELAYKNFDPNQAYLLSIPCREYIDAAFYKFYGDDDIVPNEC